jgi:signal peptidase I
MGKFEESVKKNAGYLLILAFLAAYVLTKFMLFALFCALSIVGLFVYETYKGVKEGGWKKELEEIVVAIIAGVVVWYGAGFLLHTSAPLDSIVSCSMLPRMDRGDMVVLSGSEVTAPSVEINSSEWEYIKAKMRTNFTCGPCTGQGSYVPYNFSLCRTGCSNSCLIAINGRPVFSDSNDSLFSYNYGICKLMGGRGEILNDVCVKSVTIKGKKLEEDFGNDVVVYEPAENSVFVGSTIHRVLAKVSVDGKMYYLIKGDNNEVLDVQAPSKGVDAGGGRCLFFVESRENRPVPQENIKGKVVYKVPYLGYLKLFLWGYIGTPAGCDTVVEPA